MRKKLEVVTEEAARDIAAALAPKKKRIDVKEISLALVGLFVLAVCMAATGGAAVATAIWSFRAMLDVLP